MTAHSRASAPPALASAEGRLRHLFVRNLVLPARIGVYDHEKHAPQRVRINIDLAVLEQDGPVDEDWHKVVSYVPLVEAARALVDEGHILLVETLAERLAERCLASHLARRVLVTVEKLDIFAEAEAVGVTIERVKPDRVPDPAAQAGRGAPP